MHTLETNPDGIPDRIERLTGLKESSVLTMDSFACHVNDNFRHRTSACAFNSMHHTNKKSSFTEVDSKDKEDMLQVKLVWFDYHHKCKKGNINALKELYHSMHELFSSHTAYYDSKERDVFQRSVVRTNCVDCLDRTNVVQTTVSRWILIRQLKDLGILSNDEVADDAISLPQKDAEEAFRLMWGDNGDQMSLLYAGTRALKRDVTRLGKRTKQGALDDGWNSALRYYINNYQDLKRQKAIDTLLNIQTINGTMVPYLRYKPDLEQESPSDLEGLGGASSVSKRLPPKVKKNAVIRKKKTSFSALEDIDLIFKVRKLVKMYTSVCLCI